MRKQIEGEYPQKGNWRDDEYDIQSNAKNNRFRETETRKWNNSRKLSKLYEIK